MVVEEVASVVFVTLRGLCKVERRNTNVAMKGNVHISIWASFSFSTYSSEKIG